MWYPELVTRMKGQLWSGCCSWVAVGEAQPILGLVSLVVVWKLLSLCLQRKLLVQKLCFQGNSSSKQQVKIVGFADGMLQKACEVHEGIWRLEDRKGSGEQVLWKAAEETAVAYSGEEAERSPHSITSFQGVVVRVGVSLSSLVSNKWQDKRKWPQITPEDV